MTIEQFIASVSAPYDELNALNEIDNFLWLRGLLYKALSEEGSGSFRKKFQRTFWRQEKKTLPVLGSLQ